MSKTIRCKECGTEIFSKDKKCPQCGKVNKIPPEIIAIPVVVAVIILVIIIAKVTAFVADVKEKNTKYEWPTTGLATSILQPESEYGRITEDSESYFSMNVYKVSEEEYFKYLSPYVGCKPYNVDTSIYSEGFIIDDGTYLSIMYDLDEKTMSIFVRTEQ